VPEAPPRACPRCAESFTGKRCPQCPDSRVAQRHVYDLRRGSARSRGYDRDWDRVRNYHLFLEPLCRHCSAESPDQVTAGTEVDHITPIRVGGARLDHANLQTLCHQHHARKSLEDAERWPQLRRA